MDDAVLEKIYQEKLEERIIATLAEKHGISLESRRRRCPVSGSQSACADFRRD